MNTQNLPEPKLGTKVSKEEIKSRIVSQIKKELIANPSAPAGHLRNTYTK